MSTRTLALINVAAVAVMLAANGLANGLPINGLTTGDVSAYYPNLLVPAGFTFAIWGVIYSLVLGLLAYQFFGGAPAQQAVATIGPWLAINALANAAWIAAWHYLQIEASVAIMLVIFASLAMIYVRLGTDKTPKASLAYLCVALPFSVYFAWISLALVLNITALLVSLGWSGAPLTAEAWGTALLIIIANLTAFLVLTRRDLAWGAVTLWALLGIYSRLRHVPDVSIMTVTLWVAVGSVAVAMALRLWLNARPTRSAQPLASSTP